MPDNHPAQRLSGEPLALPRSLWAATAMEAPQTTPLRDTASADVAVIGAGYMGLAAALHLAEAGLRVIVLDAAEPGWGASGRNNGQVIPGLKLDPDEVESLLGAEIGGRLVGWAGEGPRRVFELISRHSIACNPVNKGWIQPAYSSRALPGIESRVEQWSARGAPVAMLDADALARALGTPAFPGGWIDRRGGSIHPLNFARGLASAAIKAGAVIHGHSPVRLLERSGDGRRWQVTTPVGCVLSEQVIVATNAYGSEYELVPGIRRSIVPVRTAQVATRPLAPEILSTILPDRQVASDTRRLLTSFRISPDGRLVMGGAGATGGLADTHLAIRLHREAANIFGHLPRFDWQYHWSGYFAVSADHLPHIHEPEPTIRLGLGCNGRGIAVSTGIGMLLAERALGTRQADELEVPVTEPKNYPLHRFRNIGIAAATKLKRLQDRIESW